MKARELGRHRLMNLQVAAPRSTSAADVVATLGAMQAQDYAGGLWAIGLRLLSDTRPHASSGALAEVERAIATRAIVRSWPLRGTLHFVAAADLGWMLDLLAARVIHASAKRHEELELDVATFRKVKKVLTRALAGGGQLTRDEIRTQLARAKISTEGGRLYHCLWRLSLEQVLCFGVPRGKQPTFTLLGEWVPALPRLDREAALAMLATRYFRSHGPATARDLMRWAGLTSAEVKLAIGAAAKQLSHEEIDGRSYWLPAERAEPNAAARGAFLLPGFDEYILGYADRSAILDPAHASKIVPGSNGVFRPTIVHDGRVVGTWKAVATKKHVRLVPDAFDTPTKKLASAFARAGERYAAFLGRSVLVAT